MGKNMDKTIKIRNFIIDTDIGADCDDAIALAYLFGKEKARLCRIGAIALCTTRQFAPACVKAISAQFGREDIEVGIYKGAPLGCDSVDNYSEAVALRYKPDYNNAATPDAVGLIRKTLAESDERVDIVELGPLCNISALLKSEPDEYSPLCGADLVKEKAGRLYLMGCCFSSDENGFVAPEWNIEQDVQSASYVMKNFPNEIMVCPFEIGKDVTTYSYNVSGVVYDCMRFFEESACRRQGMKSVVGVYTRPSWDPVTAMTAINDEKISFVYSALGHITIDEKGVSTFTEDSDGKHRFLLCGNDITSKCEKALNEFLNSIR